MSETAMARAARATPPSAARRIRGLSDRAIAWIFVAPTIFLLLAVNIFPLIWTVRLSFTNFRANRPNAEVSWIGLRNYTRILTDDDIWLTMQATAHFLFWTIALQVLIGFALAWLINRKFRHSDMWTTIIVLPMMLSLELLLKMLLPELLPEKLAKMLPLLSLLLAGALLTSLASRGALRLKRLRLELLPKTPPHPSMQWPTIRS